MLNLDLTKLYFPDQYNNQGEYYSFDPTSKIVENQLWSLSGSQMPAISNYVGQTWNQAARNMFKDDLSALGFATSQDLNQQIGDLTRKFTPADISQPPDVPIPTSNNPTVPPSGTNLFGRPTFDFGQNPYGGYSPQRPNDMVVPPYRQPSGGLQPYSSPYGGFGGYRPYNPYQSMNPYGSFMQQPYGGYSGYGYGMQPRSQYSYGMGGGMSGMNQRQWQNQQQFRYGDQQGAQTGGQSYTPAPQYQNQRPSGGGGSMGSRLGGGLNMTGVQQ